MKKQKILLFEKIFKYSVYKKIKLLGIEDKNEAMDLLRKSRIVLMICCFYASTITAGFVFIIGIPMALNYSLVNWLLFGITWTTIWGIWLCNACMAAFYYPGYFFIVCYYLKLRLNSIRIKLNIIRNKSKSLPTNEKILMIRRLLEEHNDLCQQISNFNKYWKKYLSIAYSIFLSIICVLTYVTLIYPGLKLFLRLEYIISLSGHLLLIFIITYSASSVSHYNLILCEDLHSFYAKNSFPIVIKIKVRTSKKYLKNRLIKCFKNLL
jgi:hypothetical protein